MKKVALLVLAVVLVSLGVSAQISTGNLVGKVSMPDGTPLPGVSVTMTSDVYGTRTVITSNEGNYRFLKLPPGNFALKFELSGFKTVERTAIRVSVGGTAEIDVTLEESPIAESVVVTAIQPLIDTRKATLSSNMTKTDMETLPMGHRRIEDIIVSAPGIINRYQGEGGFAFYGTGTRDSQNRFSLDGASIDGAQYGGSFGPEVKIESLEETQISVSAHDITNITGGVSVNFVTKRGGNRYSGLFYTRVRDRALTLNQKLPEVMSKNGYVRALTKHGFWYGSGLGGPIIKDHLWFYGTFTNSDLFLTNNRGTDSRRGWEPFAGVKVNAQYKMFNADVFYQWNYAQVTVPYSRSAKATAWASQVTSEWGGPTLAANLHAGFGNLLASVKYTSMKNVSMMLPVPSTWGGLVGGKTYQDGGEYRVPFVAAFGYDYTDPVHSLMANKAGVVFYRNKSMTRPYLQGSVNYFAEKTLGGDHELLLGADRESGKLDYVNVWPNHTYILWNRLDSKAPGGKIDYFQLANDTNWAKETARTGIYFQDIATYGRLTVNFGLRYDAFNWIQNPVTYHALTPYLPELGTWACPEPLKPWAGGDVSTPASSLKDLGVKISTISPRVSLSYDLFGTGKTIAKLSLAHYGGNLVNQNMPDLVSGGSYGLTFPFKDANGNGWPDAGEFAGWDKLTPPQIKTYQDTLTDPFFSQNLWNYYTYWGFTPTGPPAVNASTTAKFDSDFAPPKVNELVVGIEQELSADVAVSLTGTYKKNYNDLLYSSWYKDKGGNVVYNTQDLYIQYAADPFTGRPLYKQREVLAAGGTWVKNAKKSYEYLLGLETRLTKRFSHRWLLNASFNYNQYKRRWFLEDYPGMFAIDYYDGSAANPAYWGGYIGNPIWTAKVSALYQLPLGFSVSGLVMGIDGFPVTNFIGTYAGNYVPDKGKFGDVRLPDHWQVNLSLEKRFAIGSEGVAAILSVQGYNILNRATVTQVNTVSIPQQLQDPRAVCSPGVIELGARIVF